MTHKRRIKGQMGVRVTFTKNMDLIMNRTELLVNKENRQQFINMLFPRTLEKNCKTYHASGDADPLIVMKAVE